MPRRPDIVSVPPDPLLLLCTRLLVARDLATSRRLIGAGTATINSSALLEFGAASSAKVNFLDATGTLQLDHATTLTSKFIGP